MASSFNAVSTLSNTNVHFGFIWWYNESRMKTVKINI
jgi:hypothetical protein